MATLQPLYDRVIIKPADPESVTASGIIIPDTSSQEKPQQGTVIAVGEGRIDDGDRIAPTVKEGDTVLFAKYAPEEVEIDGEQLLVIREDSILAIIKD